ncbi:serine/threonine-protein kinase-like protein At3g51990 [Zea mays]|uniref:Serine/threonine-protein kinase-like protein n=1 Tax=Zea mays TaxID=4577 RepID=A0A1D6M2Z8_MAIZE|nr:serine/threonine-protein kinase-like protein At3g51990 [Zea mays]AQK85557.1 Serine/threonine-protein kinase-like protein [Zea mays]|eukprot:XP_008649594.1 serine/threonine-protein kinase-like protein At3g51990 [Zea mays]
MGYLSCRADSSVATCRSITAISPLPLSRRSGSGSGGGSSRPPLPPAQAAIERFDYAELEAATSHFADAALLGRGSHGAVYKAVLPSGRAVAVKRPSPRRPEVDNEIRILSSVRGPRLVNLLGFSDPGPAPRLLVVEYMPNGTLYDLLHSNPRPPGWPRRLRLALQTARALRALHDADPPVIHRDVKSANVLLDANLGARLGDFGLALRVPKATAGANAAAAAAPTPPPAGTLGYLDPAYVTPESLSTKTDVFSFGILLLEIMSGRKAIDVQHSPPSVVEWAVPLLRKGKVASLFDPRVAPPRDPVTRKDLAALAASCVRSCRERRPSMADIVQRLVLLSKAVSAKVWNGLADGLAVVGNPCAVVDVQKTISKRGAASRRAESERESTSALVFDDDEKEDVDAEALEEDQVPSNKSPPRPLKNGIVFSEAGARERRNLLDLMARIDGVAGQRFGITRARTVRANGELIEKDAVLLLRRNQTVRVVGSEALPKSGRISRYDVKIKHKAGEEQEETGKAQDKVEKIQVNASGIQESSKEILGKTDKLLDALEPNLDKEEKVQEKEEQHLDEVDNVQENEGKVQCPAEKIQEGGEVQCPRQRKSRKVEDSETK